MCVAASVVSPVCSQFCRVLEYKLNQMTHTLNHFVQPVFSSHGSESHTATHSLLSGVFLKIQTSACFRALLWEYRGHNSAPHLRQLSAPSTDSEWVQVWTLVGLLEDSESVFDHCSFMFWVSCWTAQCRPMPAVGCFPQNLRGVIFSQDQYQSCPD